MCLDKAGLAQGGGGGGYTTSTPPPATALCPWPFQAPRWPCGPAVIQHVTMWLVVGLNPPLLSLTVGDATVLSPFLLLPGSPVAPSVSFSLCNPFFPGEHPPPDDGGGLDVADQGKRDPEGTR